MKKHRTRHFQTTVTSLALVISFLAGCSQANDPQIAGVRTETSAAPVPTSTSTPPPAPTIETYNLPAGINPLTGQAVADPQLLKTPAMLISISHFPAYARPQAGLSFAPYVFEFYITEGATRFLSVFYGEFPYPEIPVTGNCEVRREPFQQTDTLLGNRLWLDSNSNGILDAGENGVGGICVNLYDSSGSLTQYTTTDTNGYYGFNVQNGQEYVIELVLPPYLKLSPQDVGNDSTDSDFDPNTHRTTPVRINGDDLTRDAGLILSEGAPAPDPAYLPPAQVGPVRSGRLLYAHIGAFFQNSCLVYAFASPEVLERIPQCAFVQHDLAGGGYMLGIEEMKDIALQNKRRTRDVDFDYASNLHQDQPPPGGSPASKLNVYISYLNQSGWVYDPLYQGWWRYVDTSDESLAGVLFPDKDRLNGRQLHFENVIVLYARHDVVSPTNLDIHLEAGLRGKALLFRDGRVYPILWSTEETPYEKETGLRRPIRFIHEDGTPAPLKPGRTWVILVTEESKVYEESTNIWRVEFIPPPGAK